MKTTNFNAHDFYSITMASVYQLIDQKRLNSVNEIEEYLLEEAQFYVDEAPNQVLLEVLPDNLTEINEQFGEVTTKKGLAWCSLVLWMEEMEMIQDAIKYYS